MFALARTLVLGTLSFHNASQMEALQVLDISVVQWCRFQGIHQDWDANHLIDLALVDKLDISDPTVDFSGYWLPGFVCWFWCWVCSLYRNKENCERNTIVHYQQWLSVPYKVHRVKGFGLFKSSCQNIIRCWVLSSIFTFIFVLTYALYWHIALFLMKLFTLICIIFSSLLMQSLQQSLWLPRCHFLHFSPLWLLFSNWVIQKIDWLSLS